MRWCDLRAPLGVFWGCFGPFLAWKNADKTPRNQPFGQNRLKNMIVRKFMSVPYASSPDAGFPKKWIYALLLHYETPGRRPRNNLQKTKLVKLGNKTEFAKIQYRFCQSSPILEDNAGSWWQGDINAELTDSTFGIWEVRSPPGPGLDTTGLAALLQTFPAGLACHGSSSEHVEENATSLRTGGRVAPLRMGVRRAAPGSQVLADLICPWRAAWASADQSSLFGPLLGKETQKFFSVRLFC